LIWSQYVHYQCHSRRWNQNWSVWDIFFKWFMQFQHHNITSDKWSNQNNERFYHVKQTVENRRPSKMGNVATLLFVHFNFIIQFQNMFLFLKSIHIAYYVKFMLCLLSFIMLCFSFCFCFFKDMHYNTMIRTFCILKKKWRSVLFITWLCRSAVRN
jgi:hypothetical protein